jgi:hypothetical protein
VAFALEIPEHVAAYLDGLPVSQRVRERIADTLAAVENLGAEYRANAANRYPNSTLLRYSYVFLDDDRRIHTITFGIDDSPAIYGVLRIPHARHMAGGILPSQGSSSP